ncbi:9550_t:CDS:1, partial [Cetraspora pellucida]
MTNDILIKCVNINSEAIDKLKTIKESDSNDIDFSKVLNLVGT